MNASYGNFSIPNHPNSYSNNLNCTWLISVSEGNFLQLTFSISLRELGPGYCPYDYMEVFDGNSTSAPRIIKRCGSYYHWCVHSSGRSVMVRLITDNIITLRVFYAHYDLSWVRSPGICDFPAGIATLATSGK